METEKKAKECGPDVYFGSCLNGWRFKLLESASVPTLGELCFFKIVSGSKFEHGKNELIRALGLPLIFNSYEEKYDLRMRSLFTFKLIISLDRTVKNNQLCETQNLTATVPSFTAFGDIEVKIRIELYALKGMPKDHAFIYINYPVALKWDTIREALIVAFHHPIFQRGLFGPRIREKIHDFFTLSCSVNQRFLYGTEEEPFSLAPNLAGQVYQWQNLSTANSVPIIVKTIGSTAIRRIIKIVYNKCKTAASVYLTHDSSLSKKSRLNELGIGRFAMCLCNDCKKIKSLR